MATRMTDIAAHRLLGRCISCRRLRWCKTRTLAMGMGLGCVSHMASRGTMVSIDDVSSIVDVTVPLTGLAVTDAGVAP
ncbi:hypothetical protein D2917_31065 (plasmid) [Cupriavidus oxalaticus]|uniref:Uncharacterized protein n=1 Tax=Cupriavidus oxalaticus TaxID=96344 RepID=A0A5P3VQS4_9BURK|nr:hypothetical protein D2917_31065 [Cupriavidus oxalaticus]